MSEPRSVPDARIPPLAGRDSFTPLVGIPMLSLWLAGILRLLFGVWFPASLAFAVLVVAGCLAFLNGRRVENPSLRHPRGVTASRVGLLAFVIVTLLGTLTAFIVRPLLKFSDGTEHLSRSDGFFPMVGTLLVPLIAGFLAQRLAARAERVRARLLLVMLAILATLSVLAGAVVTVKAFIRSRGRVEPDHYAASLPVVGRLSPDSDLSVQGLELSATCADVLCTPVARRPGDKWFKFYPVYIRDSVVEVRDDRRSGIVVMTDGSQGWAILSGPFEDLTSSLGVWDVRATLSAPRAWIATAAIGIVCALPLLLIGFVRLAYPKGWQVAHAEPDGKILLTDGTECLPPEGIAVSDARVSVLLAPSSTSNDPYRGGETRARAVALWLGDPNDVERFYAYRACAPLALALSIAWLTAAPLITAAGFGLVF